MYVLIGYFQGNIKRIEEITDKQKEELVNCSNNIKNLKGQADRIKGVLKCSDAIKDLLNKTKENTYSIQQIEDEFKTAISNFLTQVKGLLDNSKTWLCRTYGKESYQLECFTNATHNEFDKYFHYCFIENFRNYIQHCSDVPFSSISYKLDEQSGEKKLLLTLNIEYYIKTDTSMKPKYRDRLRNTGFEEIDILDCIEKEKQSLIRIQEKVLSSMIDRKLCEDALKVYEIKAKYPQYEAYAISEDYNIIDMIKQGQATLDLCPLEISIAEYILKKLVGK